MQGNILTVSFEQHHALLDALARHLAPATARFACWWLDAEPNWPFPSESIDAESPFDGSDSILAGTGQLFQLTPDNLNPFLDFLQPRLIGNLLHVEVESSGNVVFSAYDFFEHVFCGPAIETWLLETWQAQGIITTYTVY